MIKDDFKEEPQDTTLSVGSTAMLRCRPPRGEPEPQVTWTLNGLPVSLSDPRVSMQGNGNLIIERVRKNESGEYVCKAQNLAGEKKSSPVQLTVLGRFTITYTHIQATKNIVLIVLWLETKLLPTP